MDLEKKAIERIKTASQMSLLYYKKPLVLADSGGKDSAVCRELLLRSGVPFEIQHSHTTADAPQTVYYVREMMKKMEEKGILCNLNYPFYRGQRVTMWSLIPMKMIPPTRIARYCCEVLKEQGGENSFLVTGVRWQESTKRKNTRGIYEKFGTTQKSRVMLNNDNDDRRKLFESCLAKSKHICNPIVDWTDHDVWEYIRAEKLPLNPLYDKGMTRVGCIGCPMAGKERYKEFAWFPTYQRAYIRAFEKMLEYRKNQGKPEKSIRWKDGESVFRWWMEDKNIEGQMAFSWTEDYKVFY